MAHEPVHGRRRQRIGVGIGLHRGRLAGHVDGGIDQDLGDRLRLALALHLLGDDGGEVAAHAVAADGGRDRRRTEPVGVVTGPAIGGQDVLQPGRELVIRGQAVVDRDHRRADDSGQDPAEGVAGLEIPDHPTAHVGVDDQGRVGVLVVRAIGAARHRTIRAFDRQALGADTRLQRALHDGQALGAAGHGVGGRQGAHRRQLLGRMGEELEAGIQRAAALVDDPAARHGPQDRAGQRKDQLQYGLLGGVRGHGFPTLCVLVVLTNWALQPKIPSSSRPERIARRAGTQGRPRCHWPLGPG